tara:strand:- start:66 stop:1052 length:987 start_codon:yes stop_codon:yes gene_type:complete
LNLRASPINRGENFDLFALADACCNRVDDELKRTGNIASPIPMPIYEIDCEANGVVTIWIQVPSLLSSIYKPGQYFMCWNPYDGEGGMSRLNYNSEKPYSVGDIKIDRSEIDEVTEADIGSIGRNLMGFTIKDLGRQSGELTRLKRGDWLAIRGPFGTHFPTPNFGDKLVLISGGIGSTPMHMAAKEARQKLGDGVEIHAIMGFQNEGDVHFDERMEKLCDSLTITTDDGSLGIKGYPTSPLTELLKKCDPSNTMLYTCGPELMMKNVLQMSIDSGIQCYAAMERYLPCSVAVCGLCMVGDRLTCREGPVMDGSWLLQQDDFVSHHSH